jgi:CRISPR-associated endonuclease Cas3-HD
MTLLAWYNQDLCKHLALCEDLVTNPSAHSQAVSYCKVDELRIEIESTIARLAKVLNVNANVLRRLIALAVCIHDVGKALSEYQKRLSEGCRKKETISLAGHELVSAWFAINVLNSIDDVRGLDNVKAAIASGILLHHAARRSVVDAYLKLISSLRSISEEDVEAMTELAFGCCKTLASYANVKDEVKARMLYQLKSLTPLLDMVKYITNNSYSKYGELVAYIIAIADNIDAHFNRHDDTARGIIISKLCRV